MESTTPTGSHTMMSYEIVVSAIFHNYHAIRTFATLGDALRFANGFPGKVYFEQIQTAR